MKLTPKQKLLLGLFALLSLAAIGILRTTSRPSTVGVDIRFLSYSTNAAGLRLARFDLQNNCSFTIERASFSEVQIQTPTGWQKLSTQSQPNMTPGPAVAPGGSEVFDTPAPATTGTWRYCVIFSEHKKPFARFLENVHGALRSLGLPIRRNSSLYAFHSDPVKP
jgi:hypothetical protein